MERINNGEEEIEQIYINKSLKRVKKYIVFILLLSFILISFIIYIFSHREKRNIKSNIKIIDPENCSFTAVYKVDSFNLLFLSL